MNCVGLARFLPNTKILTLCGGQPFGAQRDSLQHAPHIIVATPGRLLDHLQKGTVSLDALNTLVMDEADRMLDMGFSDAIDDVIRFAPASRQTLTVFCNLAGSHCRHQRPGATKSIND